MTMCSVVFARTPTNTHKRPSRFQLVQGAFSVVDALAKTRHLNSPELSFQSHVSRVAIVRLTFVEEQEKIGTLLNQTSQQRTSRFQCDSRLLRQKVFESSRKSVHRLDCTLDLSIALALALGRCFRHTLAVPKILDSVTEGNNAWLLILLEDDSLVPMKSRSVIRAFPAYGCVTPFAGTR